MDSWIVSVRHQSGAYDGVMSPRPRKVTSGSGATAVQIVRKHRAKVTILEHLGSTHTEAELTALLAAGEMKLADQGVAEQLELELGLSPDAAAPPTCTDCRGIAFNCTHRRHYSVLEETLGFAESVNASAFFHLVLARLVQPTSNANSLRVLADPGIEDPGEERLDRDSKERGGKGSHRLAFDAVTYRAAVVISAIPTWLRQ